MLPDDSIFTRNDTLRTIKGRRSGALVVDGEHVSIDTEWDIALVEWLLARRDRAAAS